MEGTQIEQLTSDLYYDLLDKYIDLKKEYEHLRWVHRRALYQINFYKNEGRTGEYGNTMFNKGIGKGLKIMATLKYQGAFAYSTPDYVRAMELIKQEKINSTQYDEDRDSNEAS